MSTLLTVDWDFFVPEDPRWDIGHKENALFLNAAWVARVAALHNIMRTTGEEKTFWTDFPLTLDAVGVFGISDSHAFVWDLLYGMDSVVLIDAHHDLWDAGEGLETEGEVYCHNWARTWLEGDAFRKLYWLPPSGDYSEFLLAVPQIPKDLQHLVDAGRIVLLSTLQEIEKYPVSISRVHVCRSGCWTPPWLDNEFLDFIMLGEQMVSPYAHFHPMQHGDWNPLMPRWTEKEFQEYLDALNSIPTFSIRSQEWRRYREEKAKGR